MAKFDPKNGKSLVRPSQQLRWHTRGAKAPLPFSRCALGARRENPLYLEAPMRPLLANPKKVPQVSPKIDKFHPPSKHAKNGLLLRRILRPKSKRKLTKAGTNLWRPCSAIEGEEFWWGSKVDPNISSRSLRTGQRSFKMDCSGRQASSQPSQQRGHGVEHKKRLHRNQDSAAGRQPKLKARTVER